MSLLCIYLSNLAKKIQETTNKDN